MAAAKLGRPRGEVRTALATWASAADPFSPGRTFLDLVPEVPGLDVRSSADCLLVQRTLTDMAKAGELRRVGYAPVPGANRPATLYAPALLQAGEHGSALQSLMHSLVRSSKQT